MILRGKTKSSTLGAVLALAALSACGTSTPASQSSRNLTPSYITTESGAPAEGSALAPFAVSSIEVLVSPALKVSEADVYFPFADIVWRGDPIGNRHDQVAAIVLDAVQKASTGYTTGRPAILSVELERFHGVTEKARYKIGGNYEMNFVLTLRDAQTGEILVGPKPFETSFNGAGGVRAVAEDYAGRTEKVVVSEYLLQAFGAELAAIAAGSAS